MGHLIYPDVPTADALGAPRATPLHLKVDTAMRVFVPVKMLVATDTDEMFIRIAMSGATPTQHPRIELALHDPGSGGQGTNIDPTINTSAGARVQLTDESGLVAAVANFMPRFVQGAPVYDDNVYLLKVLLFSPNAQLRIRITNKTETDRDFVWVVADNESESRQPWIHATPPSISFDMLTGETRTQDIQISNRGTGDLVVSGLDPGFPGGTGDGSQVGPLPLTIRPNESEKLSLEFNAGDQQKDFETIPQQLSSNDLGPFGDQAHNRNFSMDLRIRFSEPRFQPAPFSPKRGFPTNDELGIPGREITLFGANFNAGDLSVRFGEVEATSIVSRTATEIHVIVPVMEAPRAVQITVETGGGITQTDEEFRVSPLPIIDEFDGVQFAKGLDPSRRIFFILGSNFIAEVGDTVQVHCVFDGTGPREPVKFSEVIELDVLSLRSNKIEVQWPIVENFERLLAIPTTMEVIRSDDAFGQLEFPNKGL